MSNLLRTIQQVTRDYVDSISHRLPSIKNGTVTATSSDGTATVRVDGDTATTGSVPSIATVKTGDRVKMVLFNRQLTILGAIQRTDKLVADTIEGGIGGRNLLLSSGATVTNNAYNIRQYTMTEQMVPGETYTLRIWGSLGAGKTQFGAWINGGSIILGYLLDNGDGTHTVTFTGKEGGAPTDVIWIYAVPSSVATVNSTITRIKLERGRVPTDWTPAPEDPNPGNLSETYFYTADSALTVTGLVEAAYPTLPSGLRVVDVNRAGARMATIVNKTSDLYGTAITTTYDAYNSMYYSVLRNGTWQHSKLTMTAV